MNITYEDYLDAKDQTNEVARRYLIGTGWLYSCEYPGGIWLWSNKKLDMNGVSQETAIHIQHAKESG